MHQTTFPDSSTPFHPGLQRGMRALTELVRGIVLALARTWREAAQPREAWRRRRAIAHLGVHLLNDIGADSELLAYAAARRRLEELHTRAFWHNAGV